MHELKDLYSAEKVADLVLLDSNPLDDIRNTRRIHAVVINGHLLDHAALTRLLSGSLILR